MAEIVGLETKRAWGPKERSRGRSRGFLASFLLSTAGLQLRHFPTASSQLQTPNSKLQSAVSVFLSCLTIICAISILLSLSLAKRETRRRRLGQKTADWSQKPEDWSQKTGDGNEAYVLTFLQLRRPLSFGMLSIIIRAENALPQFGQIFFLLIPTLRSGPHSSLYDLFNSPPQNDIKAATNPQPQCEYPTQSTENRRTGSSSPRSAFIITLNVTWFINKSSGRTQTPPMDRWTDWPPPSPLFQLLRRPRRRQAIDMPQWPKGTLGEIRSEGISNHDCSILWLRFYFALHLYGTLKKKNLIINT